MDNILDQVPNLPQRQDSLTEQLGDLRSIANKMGMYDAADAITQIYGDVAVIKYGCHCDIENYEDQEPDGCVIDTGDFHECLYAKEGMRKEQCEYWKVINQKQ